MPPESIEEASAHVAEAAHGEASAVIEQAVENAQEIRGDAAESVEAAAEAVAKLTNEVTDREKDLSWRETTQTKLAELNQTILELKASHQEIPAKLESLKAELLAALTPPQQQHQENAADLPAALNEAEAISPEQTAENQSPPKKGRNWL